MGKFILLFSLLGITLMFTFGLINPTSPVMWLASTSLNFAYLRLAMMIVLASLLATHPPRNVVLRTLVGSFALGLGGWAAWGFYNYTVMPMDLLAILQFSIATGLIVLESKNIPFEQPSEEDRIIAARNARLASYSRFTLNQGV